MTSEHKNHSLQLVQTKFRLVLIPLNNDCITYYITKAFLYICSFYISRPQATRRVGVKSSFKFNFQEVQTLSQSELTQPAPGPQSESRVLRPQRPQSDLRSQKFSTQCQFSSFSQPFSALQPPGVLTSIPSQANAIREVEMLGPRYKSIFLPAVFPTNLPTN